MAPARPKSRTSRSKARALLLLSLLLATVACVPLFSTTPAFAADPFVVGVEPSSQTLQPGESTGFLVSVAGQGGFTGPVTLSLVDPAAGVTGDFAPNPVTPPADGTPVSSILTVTVAAGATIRGPVALNIEATGGGFTRSLTRQANVVIGLVPQCTGSVFGTVTDDDGPLAGVDVSPVPNLSTNAAGAYRIDGIPLFNNAPTQYTVTFSKQGWWPVIREVIVLGELDAQGNCVAHESRLDAELLRKDPAFVSGKVYVGTVTAPDYDTVIPTSTPLSGADVCATTPSSTDCAITDADGRYPPGTGELRADLFQNIPVSVGLTASLRGPEKCNPGSVGNSGCERHGYWGYDSLPAFLLGPVDPGSHHTHDFALVPMCQAALVGTVTNTATDPPTPAVGVRVDAFTGDGLRDGDTVLTNTQGEYSIAELLLGTNNRPALYLVQAQPNGSLERLTLDSCGKTFRQDLTVNLPVPGDVTGEVRDEETGQLITDEVVSVGPIGSCIPECVDTVNGRYTIHGFAPGPKAITAGETASYWKPAMPTTVTVVSGQRVEADPLLLLRRHFATITGTVRDQLTGAGIEGASVHDGFYGVPRDDTGSNGRFTLDPVQLNYRNADRTVVVEVRAEGYWDKQVDVPVVDGQVTPDQDIRLLKVCTGATITGTVLNVAPPIPVPLAGATVSAGGHVDVTDEQGHYTLGPIQVGTNNTELQIEVTAAKEGFITQFQKVTIDCGAQINLDFGHPTPATLTVHKATIGGTGTFAFSSTGGLPTPAGPDGGFTLTTTAAANPDGRTFREIAAGSVYTLTEQAASSWDLTGLACESDGASRIRYGPSPTVLHDTRQPGDTTVQVTFASGDSVTCDFTNTAAVRTGSLELTKQFVSAPASARVNLFITTATGSLGDAGSASDVGSGGSTGKRTLPTGSYKLTETAGTGTNLSGYTARLSCVQRGTTTRVPVTTTVTVTENADIVCTFTNTRLTTKSGAKTIGFWQNKNGQAVIKADAATAGACNSGAWLRGFLPFRDLASNASCAQVAGYTTTAVKAATAKGPTMNAMLKAQMLATALSTYFSTPALGGNKIAAPAPLGTRLIDLTLVCKMVDNADGSSTCSGTYRNTSASFGGAQALTVSQLLDYAAGRSNSGGSSWYDNAKSAQELAKDTFDAINNEAAFSP